MIVGVGYLGKRLAPLLVQDTDHFDKVFGTTRSKDRFGELQALGLEPVWCDVLRDDQPMPTVDVIFYCVGFDRTSRKSRHDVYVGGLQNMLPRLTPRQHFHYVSSTGVYGNVDGQWVDETTPAQPEDEGGQACRDAEVLLKAFSQERLFSATIYRLAGIYGPGRLIGARMLQSGQPVAGDPAKSLNLIHVQDAARLLHQAGRQPGPRQLYNVCDGQPASRSDFYQYVADLLKTNPPTFDPSQSGRSRGDRKVRNDRLCQDFDFSFEFPTYREGLLNCLDQ